MSCLVENKGYLYTFSKESFRNSESRRKIKEGDLLKDKSEIILTVIADDHPYLIYGVEADLNKDPKIKIVGSAGSYDALINKVEELEPDIVLLDLKMPGYEKYDLKYYLSALRDIGKCKIVIFSNETGWARIHRCLEIGAQAYIEKAIALGKLAHLIRMVHEKDEIVIYTAEELPKILFSPRQSEILHYIADGKENDEIAICLNIEIKTVQSYVNEIKEKLSEAFGIFLIRPRTLLLLASKLGFGNKVR